MVLREWNNTAVTALWTVWSVLSRHMSRAGPFMRQTGAATVGSRIQGAPPWAPPHCHCCFTFGGEARWAAPAQKSLQLGAEKVASMLLRSERVFWHQAAVQQEGAKTTKFTCSFPRQLNPDCQLVVVVFTKVMSPWSETKLQIEPRWSM